MRQSAALGFAAIVLGAGLVATTAVGAQEPIGVPECDDFNKKYDACVAAKVPAEHRAQVTASMAQMRATWKTLAANPQTKGTLVGMCKQMSEQVKAQPMMKDCKW